MWIRLRLLGFLVLGVSLYSACAAPIGLRFGESFCKKGFSCKDVIDLQNRQQEFDRAFGVRDEQHCVALWESRLYDPNQVKANSCSATEAQGQDCLDQVNNTASCTEVMDKVRQYCNFCGEKIDETNNSTDER
ncbi:MAG: hypothetical protein AAGJ35_13800 [Myxococcota bacterium]